MTFIRMKPKQAANLLNLAYSLFCRQPQYISNPGVCVDCRPLHEPELNGTWPKRGHRSGTFHYMACCMRKRKREKENDTM